MKRCRFYIILLCCLCLASCKWNLSSWESGDATMDIKVHRFDKLQNEYISFNSFAALQKMKTVFPQETKILVEDVLSIGQVADADINGLMKAFYADTTLGGLMEDALAKFADMRTVEKELTAGFRKLHDELPGLKIPRVYAQISALNQSVVVGDSILGFSIDKYMGADYPLYKQYYYDYQCRTMEPSRIVPDCLMYYLISEYPFPWDWNRSLVDHIMHTGKMHWVIARLLNYSSLEEEIGYTPEEAAWCKANRNQVWNYMLENRHLDAKDPRWVRMYMRPAPFTECFGENSPYELGVWIGTQIIDAYMKKNKDVTIAQLLNDTDYRRMLADIEFKI